MLFRKEGGLLKAADVASMRDRALAWSQFIDNFRASDANTRVAIIAEEPIPSGDDVFDARVAATVEHLCRETNTPIPTWVNDERFVLDTPYWAFNTRNPEAQSYLRETSLPEFASRQLFCGNNVLSRV